MKNKIFIAIDTKSLNKAKSIINQVKLENFKIGFKFGLEFLNSKNGRNFISKLKKKIIFVDLKLHDIPNTMSSAVIALKDLKIDYLTVHISSGLKALKEVKKVSGKTKIVGVTTLTSLDGTDLKSIGHKRSLKDIVTLQAKLASKAKLDAIVCSPHEIKFVQKYFYK